MSLHHHHAHPYVAIAHTLGPDPENGPALVNWYERPDSDDGDGPYEGYLVAGVLYVPTDGQAAPGTYITEDGLPDPRGNWYCCQTGEPAIIGLPGTPLAVLR